MSTWRPAARAIIRSSRSLVRLKPQVATLTGDEGAPAGDREQSGQIQPRLQVTIGKLDMQRAGQALRRRTAGVFLRGSGGR